VNDTIRQIIARLEAEWPGWQIWTVHRVVGGTQWRARCHDDGDQASVLNADSPEELTALLEEATAGR
jgi:hypothetical protein